MSDITVTRTRRSLAEQLREALDAMVERGTIKSWSSHYGEPRAGYYVNVDWLGELSLTPGECMDFVNGYGYGVAIGKP